MTITFEFDENWVDEDTGEEKFTDGVVYAMDLVNDTVPQTHGDDYLTFVDAKLDGVVLVDGSGYVSDEVKAHEPQHRAFLHEVMQKH